MTFLPTLYPTPIYEKYVFLCILQKKMYFMLYDSQAQKYESVSGGDCRRRAVVM